MKTIPPIRNYMTTAPSSIRPTDTLTLAHAIMQKLEIRHLPVCESGRVVGVISDGDLFRAEGLRDANFETLKASDVMTLKPYTVGPEAPLDEVVKEMARRKMGSAVIIDNQKVVGIFTSTDALGAFAELLHTRLS